MIGNKVVAVLLLHCCSLPFAKEMIGNKVVAVLLLLLVSRCRSAIAIQACVFPAIFNFGASNADTGGFSATFGPVPWPNGQTFFHRPAGRACDGRLILDFIAEKLNLPYLDAYLNSLGANFSHGANFATVGSTIMRPNATIFQSGESPFSLDVQLSNFVQFKSRSNILYKHGGVFGRLMPKPSYFTHALYTFDIGQNDLTGSFLNHNMTIQQVEMYIPELVQQFSLIIKSIMNQGGRHFWVHNTGPFGCLPGFLVLMKIPAGELGSDGCATKYNNLAQYFNMKLKRAMQQLRQESKVASITYVDVYNAKYTVISQAKNHGFQEPIKACCGHGGGEYNYDQNIYCGYTAVANGTEIVVGKACANPSVYVNWDGIHFTEAANEWVFNQIANGANTDPPLLLNMSCHGQALATINSLQYL